MIQSVRVPLQTHRIDIVDWLEINSPASKFQSLVTSHQVDLKTGDMISRTDVHIDFSVPEHVLLFKLTWGGR